ncbi:MAG: magnesium transporter [Peptostreptococcaceae bacterium]|nr:magnesium transporter [Peptostreptococcaceae bacterium]
METEILKITEQLDQNKFVELNAYLEEIHSADIVEIIMELEEENRKKLISVLSWDKISDVLEEVETPVFINLISAFTKDQKRMILEEMGQDDVVDLIASLDDEMQKELLSLLNSEEASKLQELLFYGNDTAGGIMTKDYIAVKKDISVYQAIEEVRVQATEAETVYYVYVVDHMERLVGVLSLRELIVTKPNKIIEEIMKEQVIKVNVATDQEEVAKMVAKYNLIAIPVVDDDDIIKGIITVDDIIDVIEREATEDIYKFAGTNEGEYKMKDSFPKRIWASVSSRLPWLVVTVFGGILSAKIIGGFEATLNSNTAIAYFIPLLAGMGGNVGTQSSTLTVRGLATGQIDSKEVLKIVLHEFSVGFLVGLVCSLMVAVLTFILQGEMLLSLIIGVSMWANMITAATIGTLVPLVFKRVGVDPAVASAPFISTTIDITGISIYFTLTTILMSQFNLF